MASSWGNSWGFSWGNSWGSISQVTVEVVHAGGTDAKRRREEQLQAFEDRIRQLEQNQLDALKPAEQPKAKKQKVKIEEVPADVPSVQTVTLPEIVISDAPATGNTAEIATLREQIAALKIEIQAAGTAQALRAQRDEQDILEFMAFFTINFLGKGRNVGKTPRMGNIKADRAAGCIV